MGELTIRNTGAAPWPARLQTALAKARRQAAPIAPQALAVKLERTLALWPAPENFAATAAFYREALADVPDDLVDQALRHARLTLKWFPKPAELREPIREALTRRRANLYRLTRLLENLPPAPLPPPTEADKARVTALLDALRRELAAQGYRRIPGRGAGAKP